MGFKAYWFEFTLRMIFHFWLWPRGGESSRLVGPDPQWPEPRRNNNNINNMNINNNNNNNYYYYYYYYYCFILKCIWLFQMLKFNVEVHYILEQFSKKSLFWRVGVVSLEPESLSRCSSLDHLYVLLDGTELPSRKGWLSSFSLYDKSNIFDILIYI